MSITDELREYFGKSKGMFTDHVLAIADRIDAEYQKAMSRAGQLLADAEKDRDYNYANWQDCKQKVLQHNITLDELSAEIERLEDELAHCVELPKDADGEYIRIGDMMEWVRYKDDDPTIVRTVSGIGNSVFFAWSDEQGRYAQYEAHAYRHHHEPTVEDVLRESACSRPHARAGSGGRRMSDTDATQARQDVLADVDEILEHVINGNMLGMPYDVYVELFDAVDGLGVKAEKLQAENAKLRSARDVWQENDAKLRELVADMWRELAAACAEQVTSHETLREFSDRMRELGVSQ